MTEPLDEVSPEAALRLVAKLVDKPKRNIWNVLKRINTQREDAGRPTYALPPEPR